MLDQFSYPIKPPDFSMDLSRMADLDPVKVKYCVWHHVGAATDTDSTAASANAYHIKNKGWAGIGYHGLIRWDGTLELGRPFTKQGVHTKNHNHESIAVCLAGNFSIGNILDRPHQYAAVVELAKLALSAFPGIEHVRHSNLRPTACPGKNFPWEQFIKDVGNVGTPIIGPPTATVAQMQTWAKARGAHERFIKEIIPALYQAGIKIGIDPAVMVAQSAKETAFGKFSGTVPPTHHNTGGIKTAPGGGDKDPSAHEIFQSWDEGARAHGNHLAAHLGIPPIGTPHGRYYTVLKLSSAGKTKYVEDLGGYQKWNSNPDYGHSIIRLYLRDLWATSAPNETTPDETAELRKQLVTCHEARMNMATDMQEAAELLARLTLIFHKYGT